MIGPDQEAISQGVAPDQQRLGDTGHFKQAQFDIAFDISQKHPGADYGRTHGGAVGIGGDLTECRNRHGKLPGDLALGQFFGFFGCTVDGERKGNGRWRGRGGFVACVHAGIVVIIGHRVNDKVFDEQAALRCGTKDHGGQGRNAPIGQVDRFIGIKDGAIAQTSIPTGRL
ncbi:hypothetical protein TALK_10455 [Thalassospira alkalitolerans]|uniref:Uncharacterized protein n=1 Tax=Thalassospira alkalitolerans TaxID=1293890 RepID=A0A1Y2LDA5_9PROT|nr:hypothetical protein TALK_10455 [Thalassospira alkalitolerans]